MEFIFILRCNLHQPSQWPFRTLVQPKADLATSLSCSNYCYYNILRIHYKCLCMLKKIQICSLAQLLMPPDVPLCWILKILPDLLVQLQALTFRFNLLLFFQHPLFAILFTEPIDIISIDIRIRLSVKALPHPFYSTQKVKFIALKHFHKTIL